MFKQRAVEAVGRYDRVSISLGCIRPGGRRALALLRGHHKNIAGYLGHFLAPALGAIRL
jgi:hypothetical protein